jgi:hypothetical protein
LVRRLLLLAALGVATAALSLWPVRHAEPAKDQDPIAALVDKVLANPLDADATEKLEALRAQRRRQRKSALAGLESGLRAYLDGRYGPAAKGLDQATASKSVTAAADAALAKTVNEILRECQQRAPKAPRKEKPKAKGICPRCGNSGWADCPVKACAGSGWVKCSACNGRGTITVRKEVEEYGFTRTKSKTLPCPKCKRRGGLKCDRCGGNGFVRCRCGAARRDAARDAPKPKLGENERKAIRKVIARTSFRRNGGIDLAAPGALRCSPRLKKK